MKQIIFITIFVLCFCFVSLAQNDEPPPQPIYCPRQPLYNPKWDDLFVELDRFYNELSADRNLEGFIIIQLVEKDKLNKKKRFLRLFNKWFDYRKQANKSRITFLISEKTDKQTTVDFNLEYNFKEINKTDYTLVKGEDLRQAINTIFKKN